MTNVLDQERSKHTLPITLIKLKLVRFPIQFLLTLHRKCANATQPFVMNTQPIEEVLEYMINEQNNTHTHTPAPYNKGPGF